MLLGSPSDVTVSTCTAQRQECPSEPHCKDRIEHGRTQSNGNVLCQSSVTGNHDYVFGTYSPPFILNPSLWDGVRKYRFKTELMVVIGWRKNEREYRNVHYIIAYIHPESFPYVKRCIDHCLKEAAQTYTRNFGFPLLIETGVFQCSLGTAKAHLSQDIEQHVSVFLHQPDKRPAIVSKNWPPEAFKSFSMSDSELNSLGRFILRTTV